MSELTTIKLSGFMAKKYAKSVKLAGENWFQLMSGLEHRFGPEFVEDVIANDWHLFDGAQKKGNDLTEDDIANNTTLKSKVIHLVPVIKGENSAVSIIVGLVVAIVGIFTWNPYLIGAGAAMALGGAVSMMMTPKLGGPDQGNDRGAEVFNGAVNITSQGGPVPLVYGRHYRVSSVVISTDFSSDRTG